MIERSPERQSSSSVLGVDVEMNGTCLPQNSVQEDGKEERSLRQNQRVSEV